jgi:hypothetical protein
VNQTPVRCRVAPALLFGLMLIGPGLSGCGEVRNALGYNKKPPDEFAVIARAPLSVPPNFALRPPEPGAQRPQEPPKRHGARDLIVKNTGGAQGADTTSDGTIRRLLRTGEAEPGIREIVNRETAAFVYEDEFLIDKVLFWKPKAPRGIVVDAEQEKKRLQENAALGKKIDEGETPTIKRKRGGILEGLF